MYPQLPRENTGTRSPLGPNRRNGMFLGSNSRCTDHDWRTDMAVGREMIVILISNNILTAGTGLLTLAATICFVMPVLTRTVVETNLCHNIVSTSLQTNFHAFSIAFRNSDDPLIVACGESSSLLIQISSLRRNSNLLTLVIKIALNLGSRCSSNQALS